MTTRSNVKIGQVWADNDPRAKGRLVRIVEGGLGPSEDPSVLVEVVQEAGLVPLPKTTRRTRIKVRRFRPNSTGYRLVEDVP